MFEQILEAIEVTTWNCGLIIKYTEPEDKLKLLKSELESGVQLVIEAFLPEEE